MKTTHKLFLLCLLNFCLSLNSFTQSPIENVNRRLSREGDKLFIEYDLIRGSTSVKSYSVKLQLKIDGAAIEDPKGLSGHVGPVTPGSGKRITWDLDADLGKISGEVQIDLSVTEVKDPCIPIRTAPVYFSMGGAVLSGAGLVLLGTGEFNKRKEPYTYYQDHLNPEDTNFYGPNKAYPSRDAAYDEANKRYRNGLFYIGTGGALIAGGVVMFIQLTKIKKYNKSCESNDKDSSFHWEPTLFNGNIHNPGILLTYRF